MATKQDIVKQKIQEIKDTLNTVSKEEFVAAFKQVIAFVKKNEDRSSEVLQKAENLLQQVENLKNLKDILSKVENVQALKDISLLEDILERAKNIEKIGTSVKDIENAIIKDNQKTLKDIESKINTEFTKLFKEQNNTLNFARDKIRDIKNGKDADPNEVAEIVRGMIEIPEVKEETPEETRDKLEKLEGDERLDKKAIRGLEEALDELKKRPVGQVAGGVTDMRIRQAFKYIAHTEAPSGDIDGANTTYTVNNDIWWIAGFTLNGENIAELPNFTYAGKTITFTSAIPASYAGKDWEVKYIG